MKAFIQVSIVILGNIIFFAGLQKTNAEMITYTLSGVGSGKLGTQTFVNDPFTIISVADTSQLMNEKALGFLRMPDITTTITINGLGTATFTVPVYTTELQNIGASLGDRNPPSGNEILVLQNPIFDTYNLVSSIGPVSGSPIFSPDIMFSTSDGNFDFISVSKATFQATLPDTFSTFALLAVSAAILAGCPCVK